VPARAGRRTGALVADRNRRLEVAADPAPALPPAIDTSTAHPARVYNYWLGGKDNYEADRAAAQEAARAYPGVAAGARAQRAFLAAAVGYLAGPARIRQFLDIGTGLPTADNTHEVAQRVAPRSRVVYVDNDPLVLVHARALLASGPDGATAYLDADLRGPGPLLEQAAATLDLGRPVAVMLIGILHLMAAVPPGSWLALSHPASDVLPEAVTMTVRLNRRTSVPATLRTRHQVAGFFSGLDLLDPPGIVQVHRWRPGAPASPGSPVAVHCGLASKSRPA
jgi:hypothetical protein